MTTRTALDQEDAEPVYLTKSERTLIRWVLEERRKQSAMDTIRGRRRNPEAVSVADRVLIDALDKLLVKFKNEET